METLTMGKVQITNTILRGDRVAYAHRFLDDTGQFNEWDQGPAAPTHWGFHARGTVIHRKNGSSLCHVEWDNGERTHTLAQNLRILKEEEE